MILKDLLQLLQKIVNKQEIITEADGTEEIFDFLKSVNDLVRISSVIGVKFPFESYQSVQQLPVIEIEFNHLNETEQSLGRLVLLDTPGPNEAGQTHLRPMLQDQLSKASAILAVMDYTQLRSEADAQVRSDLLEIAETNKDRIYALVNKFDNCDRNSMQADEVKEVVESLTNNIITQKNIFPVSSKFAYLANRARHEFNISQTLPNADDHPWVADFYQTSGIDIDDEDDLNPENINKKINKLWKNSKFSLPLEEVVKQASENAGFITLESAVDKMEKISDDISNLLTIRHKALNTNNQVVKAMINSIQENLDKLKEVEKETKKKLTSQLSFFDGQIKEIINTEFDLLKTKISESDFSKDSNNEILEFDDEYDLKDFEKKFKNQIKNLNAVTYRQMELSLNQLIEKFDPDFYQIIECDLKKVMDIFSKIFSDNNFQEIKLPSISKNNIKLKYKVSYNMKGVVSKRTTTETYSKVVNKFTNFFNDGWGREDYDEIVTEITFNLKKAKKYALESLFENKKELLEVITSEIYKPRNEYINELFAQLSLVLEGLRGDFTQSLKDQKVSAKEQEILQKNILELVQMTPALESRVDVLKQALHVLNLIEHKNHTVKEHELAYE